MWFGPFEAIVGHSFGRAASFNEAAGAVKGFEQLSVKCLVLLVAPYSIPKLFDDSGLHLYLWPKMQQPISGQVQRMTGTQISRFTDSGLLMRLAISTLVNHAPNDREVSAKEVRAMAGAGERVRLFWAEASAIGVSFRALRS